jgi:hypothetical protein
MDSMKTMASAADSLADTVPESAGELDQLLAGINVAFLRVAEGLAAFAEGLDAQVGLDSRVAAPIYAMSDNIADAARGGKDARRAFLTLYAPQLENDVRQPKKPDFFED